MTEAREHSSLAGMSLRAVGSLGEIVASLPPREATLVRMPDLEPELSGALRKMGASRLYSHQLEAYERVRAGENVVVATATASGKSLCYKIVAVDEAHVLRGVFGSHVAAVLRRLRRVARLHGGDPRFVLTSATIANPQELAESLMGLPFTLVDNDGASTGERRVIFRNPPLLDKGKGGGGSLFTEGALVFTDLVSQGVRTMAFARTRKSAELIYRYAADRL